MTYREAVDPTTPEDTLIAREEGPEPEPLVDHRQARLLQRALKEIPAPEREALQLSMAGKTQQDIAEILNVSQPTVGNRVRRAKRRLRWLAKVGLAFTPADIESRLTGKLEPKHVEVLAVMWQTTNIAETAAVVRASKSGARKRFLYALGALERLATGDVVLAGYLAGLRSLREGGGGRRMRHRWGEKRLGRAS